MKLGREGLAFKVNGDEGGGARRVQRGLGEEIVLPGLRGGVIDLKDAEGGRAVTEREGIEAGAKKDVLGGAVRYGSGEGVFGEARPGDDKGAKGVGVGAVGAGGCALELRGVDGAEDGDGERVGKDKGVGIDELMGRAAEGDAKGGARWRGAVHGERGYGSETPVRRWHSARKRSWRAGSLAAASGRAGLRW